MSAPQPGLIRALRRRDLIGLVLNAMIGSGMLAAPAKVYGLAGDWAFLVLAASALAILPLILCYADLGSRFSGTGGPYLYARAALPPPVAFVVGWLMWFAQAMAAATLSNLFVTYLAGFFPALGEGWPRLLTIVILGVSLTAVTLRGIEQSAAVSNGLLVVKVVFVLGFVAACLPFVHLAKLAPSGPLPDAGDFAKAMLVFVFGFTGFERGAILASEAENPRRDIPVAMGASVALVTLIYAGVLMACIGVLDAPAANDRPLAEAGKLLYGGLGAAAISAGAIVVILGTLFGNLVAQPRLLLALAENGQAPAALGRLHSRWRTPFVAILVSNVIAFSFAMMSDLLTALTMSTAARMIAYSLSCVALARMSGRVDAPEAGFKLPAVVPVALLTALMLVGVMLLGAAKELAPLGIMTGVGLVLFLLVGRKPRSAPVAPDGA